MFKREEYQKFVNKIHERYEEDTERLAYAKKIMPHHFYTHYEIETLQRRSFFNSVSGAGTNNKPTVTFNLEDVDGLLRAISQLSDYVVDVSPYGYVSKKSKNFIETLKQELYK